MEQAIPEGPNHVYAAKTRFDLTQVNHSDTPAFPAEVDLGFGTTTTLTVGVRGITIVDGGRMDCSQKLHELLEGAEILIEEVSPEEDPLYGFQCDVWFKPSDGPQFLSLAHSLVSCGVAEPK